MPAELLIPPWGSVSTRPRCHACQSIIVVDIGVSNEMWKAVVHPSLRNTYMCINCFASRADEKMIDWAKEIELRPLSLARQVRINEDRPRG